MSKEDVEHAHIQYDYKPGFKRISQPKRSSSSAKIYQEKVSEQREREAEEKMKELENFLTNPFVSEEDFDDDLYKKFMNNNKK